MFEKGRGDDGAVQLDRHKNRLSETMQLVIRAVGEHRNEELFRVRSVLGRNFDVPVDSLFYWTLPKTSTGKM